MTRAMTTDETLKAANKFYSSFAGRDFQSMGEFYNDGDEAVFTDPIFQGLSGAETKAMWQMLLQSNTDLRLKFQIESAVEDQVVVAWVAEYTLGLTGRAIHNEATSTLNFVDGKIVRQQDEYDLCKWAKMGFGTAKGMLICNFPNQTIRPEARKNLNEFIAKNYN